MLTLITLEEELRRSPQLRAEYLQMLREWLRHQPHLPNIDDDITLAMFLRSCEYSIERTKVTIDNYYSFRTHVPEMIVERNTNKTDLQQNFDVMQIVVLEDRDSEGNLVMVERLRHSNPTNYNPGVALKVNLMLIEGWVRQHGTAPGVVLVLDQTAFGLAHLAKVPVIMVKRILYFMQDCSNIAVRGIHVVNANNLIDKIVLFVKPFMNKKLSNMLKIHTEGSMNEFYKYVPKEILPVEYGGPKKTMNELHAKAMLDAERYNSLFENLDKLVVDESKRVGKAANAETLFGVQGSFKKLDID